MTEKSLPGPAFLGSFQITQRMDCRKLCPRTHEPFCTVMPEQVSESISGVQIEEKQCSWPAKPHGRGSSSYC